MLTALRELAEEAEAGGDVAAIVARGDCVARTTELRPRQRRACRRGAAGLVELCAASPPRSRARRFRPRRSAPRP
jgi:hypothetical protein